MIGYFRSCRIKKVAQVVCCLGQLIGRGRVLGKLLWSLYFIVKLKWVGVARLHSKISYFPDFVMLCVTSLFVESFHVD